jgi:hypothetical protein
MDDSSVEEVDLEPRLQQKVSGGDNLVRTKYLLSSEVQDSESDLLQIGLARTVSKDEVKTKGTWWI